MFGKVWRMWKLFSQKMGHFQTRILLFLIYFFGMGLVALPLRAFGKDFMTRGEKLDHSYWYIKEEVSSKLEDQMKQF